MFKDLKFKICALKVGPDLQEYHNKQQKNLLLSVAGFLPLQVVEQGFEP